MKPVLEHLPKNAEESFVVKYFDYNYYPTPWHFHPEYELVLVTESFGKRFIGDSLSSFKPGDLVLIGPNLPHLYRNDEHYYQEGSLLRAKSIVVHFSENSFGDNFFNLPEAKKIRALLNLADRGLDIFGSTNKVLHTKMHELVELSDFARWIKLLEILEILSNSNEFSPISTLGVKGVNEKESGRMEQVLSFVMNNFQNEISLKDAADIANMTENSFSRYFKQRTRKSFVRFLIEVRLNNACKLLTEQNLSILDISLASGFNNISNFNRQFKSVYKINPLTYQKHYTLKSS